MASATEESQQISDKKIRDELTCSICRGLYDTPTTLPCKHVFCANCIALISKGKVIIVHCHVCQVDHDVPSGDLKAFETENTMSNLCEALRNENKGKCHKHLEELMHICNRCQEMVCAKCLTSTHTAHGTITVAEHQQNILQDLAAKKKTAQEARRNIEKVREDLESNHKNETQELELKAQAVYDKVEMSKRDLLDAMTDTLDRKRLSLQQQADKLKQREEEIRKAEKDQALQSLQDSINSPTDIQASWKQLQVMLSQEVKYAPVENSSLMIDWSTSSMPEKYVFGEVTTTLSATANESTVDVTPTPGEDDKVYKVCLHLRDRVGTDVQSDPASDIGAFINFPTEECIQITLQESSDYKAQFTAKHIGKYTVIVKISGDIVKNCPYSFVVKPNDKLKEAHKTTNPALNRPRDIAGLKDGYIVVDKKNAYLTDGEFVIKEKLAPPERPKKQGFEPTAVAVDSRSGRILITDRAVGSVVIYTMEGKFAQEFGQDVLKNPVGVAVSIVGNVYVVDADQNCVYEFSPSNTCLKTIGQLGSGINDLQSPSYIAVNSKDYVLVSDSKNHRIQVFDPMKPQTVLQTITVQLNKRPLEPRGLAIDSNDNIFVSVIDSAAWFSGSHHIMVYTSIGEFVTYIGSQAALYNPRGLALTKDAKPKLLVADERNHCIKEFEL